MKFKDLFIMSGRNLWRRKLRTFLAVLSVIIGSSSIVLMLSLGLGLKKSFREMLSSTADLSVIKVMPSNMSEGYEARTGGMNRKIPILDDNFVKNLRRRPDVSSVIPVIRDDGIIATGKNVLYADIKAVNPSDMKDMGLKLDEGRFLQEGDKDCVVLGYEAARDFRSIAAMRQGIWENDGKAVDINKPFIFTYDYSYGHQESKDPWSDGGQEKKLPQHRIKVVGILKQSEDYESAYSVFFPIKSIETYRKAKEKVEKGSQESSSEDSRRSRNKNKYSYVSVKVKEPELVDSVNESIKAEDFRTESALDQLKSFNEFTNVIQLVLGGIGAISLIVAAIGITNTMIMSIYERTKEIGVMKVIGASVQDIRNLFLFEAAFIGALGGFIGAVISFGASFFISKLLENSPIAEQFSFNGEKLKSLSYVPLWLVVAAVAMTALVGIIAGYFPARRATKLSALDAIRSN